MDFYLAVIGGDFQQVIQSRGGFGSLIWARAEGTRSDDVEFASVEIADEIGSVFVDVAVGSEAMAGVAQPIEECVGFDLLVAGDGVMKHRKA